MELEATVSQADLTRTLRKLDAIGGRPCRAVLRKATARVGSATVKQVRNAAPRGETGNFRRSIAKKDRSYSHDGTYVSIVGQNRKRRSTSKQRARLARRGALSRGLSGRGLQPSIAWIEGGTRPHAIRPVSARALYWRSAGRIRGAHRVRHPGHAGSGFLSKTERSYRGNRVRMFATEIEKGVDRIARQ